MKLLQTAFLATALLASGAWAIDELFDRNAAAPFGGFMPAEDPAYQKECGGCHFVHSAGLLPARSWAAMMGNLQNHFGENVKLAEPMHSAISRYLQENAADRSRYTGSKVLMESLPASVTPQRVMSVPRLRTSHRVIREVIDTNSRVKVKTLANCDACHQRASEGDFSYDELVVRGLTSVTMIRSRNYRDR